jgi:hypothetical protein
LLVPFQVNAAEALGSAENAASAVETARSWRDVRLVRDGRVMAAAELARQFPRACGVALQRKLGMKAQVSGWILDFIEDFGSAHGESEFLRSMFVGCEVGSKTTFG